MSKPNEWDTIEWEPIDAPSGNFAKFNEAGDFVAGYVVTYDPTKGGRTFDGEECGVLVLKTTDGEHTIVTLDKPRLATVVASGQPVEGKPLKITFVGMKDTKSGGRQYKDFEIVEAKNWKPKPVADLDF